MMKRLVFALIFISSTLFAHAQKLYDEKADWKQQVETALQSAQRQNKHLLVQFGGNWCKWCLRFNEFVNSDAEIKQLVDSNFVVLHLDYKKDEQLLSFTDFADRFGFPVLIIYDKQGRRLHTQSTDLLEKGESYDKEKVLRVFKNWTPDAVSGKLRRK